MFKVEDLEIVLGKKLKSYQKNLDLQLDVNMNFFHINVSSLIYDVVASCCMEDGFLFCFVVWVCVCVFFRVLCFFFFFSSSFFYGVTEAAAV